MKTIFKISAVLALMFVTTTSMAKNTKISLASVKDAKSIIVELDEQAQESTIRLTDADNNQIFFENINENHYAKKFNLKDLENGTYFFVVTNPLQSVIFTLRVKGSEVKVVNREENNPKPIFRKVGNKIYLNFLNQEEGNVAIVIVDDQERVIFNETSKDDFMIRKAFNFQFAVKGRYTVKVNSGKHTYYENIVIG